MNYRASLGSSRSLLAAVPLFGVSTGALFPIVALRLDDLGSDAAFIGLVTTLYYCGSFLAALVFGKAVSRVGYRVGFGLSALLAAAATFALTLTDGAAGWLILRFIGGFSLGAYYVVVDGWFQGVADRRSRGKLFATYETIRLAATSAGPFLLVLGSLSGSLRLVAIAYLASIVPAVWTPEPHGGQTQSYSFTGLLDTVRCFPGGVLIAACGGIANASFYGLSAVYASQIGLSASEIAFFVAFVLFAPAVTEIPLGAFADRFTRMGVALGCGAAAATACLVLVSLQSPSLLALSVCGAVVGGAMVPMYAFGSSRIVDASDGADTVQAASAGLIAYNLGAFSGPVLAGASMSVFGAGGLYVFLGAIAALAGAVALSDLRLSRCCPETVAAI